MARTAIPVTDILITGVTVPALTNGDATNDHSVANGADGRTVIEVVSSDAGTQSVEIVANPSLTLSDGLTINNLSVSVAAGATLFIGPFRSQSFKQDASNTLYVNPSVSNTLDFRAWRVPAPS